MWSEGDWNNDGRFDSADLVLALSTGNYEHGRYILVGGPRAAIAIFEESPGDDINLEVKLGSSVAVDNFFEKLGRLVYREDIELE